MWIQKMDSLWSSVWATYPFTDKSISVFICRCMCPFEASIITYILDKIVKRIEINLCFQNVYLTIKYYPLHSKIQRYWIRHWPPPFALAFISQFDISTNIYSHIGQTKRRHPFSILPTMWILGPAKENFILRKILKMAETDIRWNALGPSPVDFTLDGNNQDSHDINKKV